MVLNEQKENISSNVNTEKTFTIEANAAAFQILSDKLYKYPIRAIIRELGANAIDAHRVAKIPLDSWEITLPTKINPTFAIEDHGIGMSAEEIDEVYTTFFKSTKSNSNDQTGMFGLGSKTPFAYTKQFIVESSKNGEKNIFSMFTKDGMPNVALVNPKPIPTQNTGTKVSFAVQEKDFDEFYEAVIYSSAVWPGLPKINGSSEFYSYLKNKFWKTEFSAEEILKKTNDVYSKGSKLPKENNGEFVKLLSYPFCLEMGNVLYYVSTEMLGLPSIFSSPNGNYVLHAPIGAVSITPNREDLQYDEKTIEFLKKEIKSTVLINFEFNFSEYESKTTEALLKLTKNELNDEAQKALENLKKDYAKMSEKLEKINTAIDNKDIFVIRSFSLRNSSRNLISAWRPLSLSTNGNSTLSNFYSSENMKVKIVELKEGEYNRYKVVDGALTGFFNSRINRMNRDSYASFNKILASDNEAVKRYNNDDFTTPMFIFCKENKSNDVIALAKEFKSAEIIKNFSKLPNSFDYGKVVEEKEKTEIDDRVCLEARDYVNPKKNLCLKSLKQLYPNTKIVLAMKPGNNYDFIDFKKYCEGKEALDKFSTMTIGQWEVESLIQSANREKPLSYVVVIGKPSEFKKMKIFDSGLDFADTSNIRKTFEKIADETALKSIVELEKLPLTISTQRVISNEFLKKARGFLPANSKFLNYIENEYNNAASEDALQQRRALISRASTNKRFQSEAIKTRYEIYEMDKNILDNTKSILVKIESYPMGKVFVRQFFHNYYSRAEWSSETPYADFFEVVALSEK